MKLSLEKREFVILGGILFAAFLVRLMFFSNPGYQTDTGCFTGWFQTAANSGLREFYNNTSFCDYPPFNIYLFWGFGSIAKGLSLFGTSSFLYIMKLPSTLFDIATAFVIFLFVRKHSSFKMAVLATGIYAFNVAVIFNTAIWGQFDAIYTFFLVFSLYLFSESKPHYAMVVFMLGILTKPQSVALAPLFLYLVLRKNKWKLKGVLLSTLAGIATVIAVIIPFEWSNPVSFLIDKYVGAYSTASYQVTSLNAFNFWGGFVGLWVPDSQGLSFLTFNCLGWIMFGAVAIFTLYFVHKQLLSDEVIVLFGAFVLFFAFFMLPTRIHERYLFPAIAILAMLFPFVKKARPLLVVLTATLFVNEVYVFDALVAAYPSGANIIGHPIVPIVSLINSLAFVYVLMLMIGELRGKRWLGATRDVHPVTTLEEITKNAAA